MISSLELTEIPSSYTGDLADDLIHDKLVLSHVFNALHIRWVSTFHLAELHLRLSPTALLNLHLLESASVGRWSDGYRPGQLLQDALNPA